MKQYEQLFSAFVHKTPELAESISLIKQNAQGGAWLIGGTIYRNLANDLYGTTPGEADYDFILEPKPEIVLPEGWVMGRNSYGNLKLVGPNMTLDFVPLTNIHSIQRRGLLPTIDNFLTGTPLTIQSFAYDIINDQLLGEIGAKAIRSRTVGVNNVEQAEIYAQRKGVSVEALIRKKADDLGFRAVL